MTLRFFESAVPNAWLFFWTAWGMGIIRALEGKVPDVWHLVISALIAWTIIFGYTAWQTRPTRKAWINWIRLMPRPYDGVEARVNTEDFALRFTHQPKRDTP